MSESLFDYLESQSWVESVIKRETGKLRFYTREEIPPSTICTIHERGYRILKIAPLGSGVQVQLTPGSIYDEDSPVYG